MDKIEIKKEFTEIYNGNLSNGLKENTSGLGENSKIPEEIKKWNWGAFFFNWIWGLSNNVYIALLCFIPFVNFFMLFYLGFKGNELAWKAKRWESIESFISTQKKWSLIGITIFGSIFSLVLILILIQTF